MLIHIGNGYLVRDCDVVGIFDLDGAVTPEATTEFLKRMEAEGKCDSAVLDLPRSFVLEAAGSDEKVILSHISSTALASRDKGY